MQWLRDDFRHQLEVFYAALKLAPPYHSVEKAITTLTTALKIMSPEERAGLADDPALRWEQYAKAFVESGLHLKHRGIIAGLVRSKQITDLPPEHEHFVDAYLK
jgi:hypothetical protein